ncbi:hypothetical protein BUALT_Bualt02G0022600 [Buddleja alternifolia]|uniref:Transcription repressor n=1 Tax=Buddleja alternifolia TaxID=168488 RepID=A0AAV6Y7Z8_9LAMI|nr:hypothetical protein BUALT_Bualt02G0022600 [Buddleja alternifolia]
MSSIKKWKLKNIITSDGGCGCGTNSKDLIIEPKPKSKPSFSDHKRIHYPSSSASSHGGGHSTVADEDYASTTFSLNIDDAASPQYCPEKNEHTKFTNTVSPSCPKLRNSFAIVKDSDDPYQDFRRSMLQMIFEKEIYSKNDLQQLLDCFLQLNSPRYHEVIVRAFMEIWNNGGVGEEAPPPCLRREER